MINDLKPSLWGLVEMEIPLLGDIAVIFVLSVIVLFIFHKIKAPALWAFLLPEYWQVHKVLD
jgi:hypothetical protein